MNKLEVELNSLKLKSPMIIASGIYGKEYNHLLNFDKIGAVITKTITKEKKLGNLSPRICELKYGMINSIGLQNEGIENFIKFTLPEFDNFPTKLFVSFSGNSIKEFCEMLEILEKNNKNISAYEINISCPNVENEGLAFGVDPNIVETLTKELKKISSLPLIIKLSPNVTSISDIAYAAEQGGADIISMINTLFGMKIDINTRKPLIKRGFGGYSGPGIMPVALKMTFDVCRKVKIPVIAGGGIFSYSDALEFLIAGAKAFTVGTLLFTSIKKVNNLTDGIIEYLDKNNFDNINMIINSLNL